MWKRYGVLVKMITSFKGKHAFLSNMFPLPNGLSVEHLFQASKTLDNYEFNWVLDSKNGYEAKARGKRINLRSDWQEVKDDVMLDCVREKFILWDDLGKLLINTGDQELIEVNTWGDRYWGTDINFNGLNKLGKILMQVRNEIQ